MASGTVSSAVTNVALPNSRQDRLPDSDKVSVPPLQAFGDHPSDGSGSPWSMQMRAVSLQEPGRLVRILTGGILGCGGWVLSRGASDTGRVNLLFEFERQACVDIYTVLIASGIELSQNGHSRFTEERNCEIASVDLEVLTFALDAPKRPLPSR